MWWLALQRAMGGAMLLFCSFPVSLFKQGWWACTKKVRHNTPTPETATITNCTRVDTAFSIRAFVCPSHRVYLRGMNRDELVEPMPGRPWRTGR